MNIFESFKIIFRGTIFWIRAKEVLGWVPDLMEDNEEDYDSNGVSKEGDLKGEDVGLKGCSILGEDNDDEEVSETKFEEGFHTSSKKDASVGQMDTHYEEPFKIYELLNKKKEVINEGPSFDSNLKYPPGFTPTDDMEEQNKKNGESKKERGERSHKGSKKGLNDDVAESVCSGLAQKAKKDWVKELCVKIKKEALVKESNAVANMMKNLKYLKQKIREWHNENKKSAQNSRSSLKKELVDLDKVIDNGEDGIWMGDPLMVKREFLIYFKTRFAKPDESRIHLNMHFPNTLSSDQRDELELEVTKEEIKRAVWDCGIVKSPGPDGSNSSFIALIPKIPDANMVKDFRPISLIGSLYKIIAKILANRLVNDLGDIVNEIQSAFVADKQILNVPFILNELFQWCKSKKKQSLIFKVDFEKAYDSVRWDFLDDILKKFGFGDRWYGWIRSCLNSSRGSIIVNGMFKGIALCPALQLSHMFYADDAVFHMGIYVEEDKVAVAASKIGCLILKTPFSYLGSKVGGLMSRIQSWSEVINRVIARLSNSDEGLTSIGIHLLSFFNGNDLHGNKTSWVKWEKVLASKEKGGLGVSSLHVLNRGLMLCNTPKIQDNAAECNKVVRLGINPMIQPEPEDLPKDNPKLEIAVLRTSSDTNVFTMKMEILLEPASNKLLVGKWCMSMLVKDIRSQDGKDDKDNDKGSKSRSQSMKEQAYNKEQRERPRPHELNDESNLIDLMKECHQ
ncbi:RNA-directed DNA polymerase, eukaryota [Tanacetum coccineum]